MRAVLRSVYEGAGLSFSVVMARQAGKNELSAQLEALLLLTHLREPLDGIKCAPTMAPQGRISMRRLWDRLRGAGLDELLEIEDGRAVRVGLARQLFLSADGSANVVGHTAGLLLEVDEAQDVPAGKFDREFRPMAAPHRATTVYYGTPWDDSTLLARAVERHRELERRDGIKRHFEADWTEVARYNPAYGQFVEGERRRLGEDHPLFATQYALRTVAGGGRLFTGSQRAQLQGTHPRRQAPADGETYVAGLDIGGQELGQAPALQTARPGRDATVLTIARAVPPAADALINEPRLEVVEHVAVTGEAHDALYARLADLLCSVWRVRRLAADATGLGETLCRLLMRALGDDLVRPVRFTSESKSRLGYALLAAVNGGRLKAYAADGSAEYAQFWREMEQARAAYRTGRTLNFYVDPADGHDDYLMSLALAVEAGRDLEMKPRVARGRISELSVLN
jgi:hypothetical protein